MSNVAPPQDWMSPDVKVYQAYVEIDDDRASSSNRSSPASAPYARSMTDEKAEQVLAIPLPAVLPPKEKGAKPRCFVMTPTGPEMREIETGLSDNIYVEVKSGLSEGEMVVQSRGHCWTTRTKRPCGRRKDRADRWQGPVASGRRQAVGKAGRRSGRRIRRREGDRGGGRGGRPATRKAVTGSNRVFPPLRRSRTTFLRCKRPE